MPIRDENLVFSPIVNSLEVGATYTQAISRQINNARFYAHELTYPQAQYQVAAVNLYPYGQEDQTGPIYRVVIPTNAVTTTGTGISLSGASTYPEALYQPGDSKYVQFAYASGGLQYLSFYFDINSYPELNNKRILNVSLVYSGSVQDADGNGNPASFVNPTAATQAFSLITQCNDAGSGQQFSGKTFVSNTGSLDELNTVLDPASASVFQGVQLGTLDMGDINNCWNTASLGSSEKMPWRYADLQRLQSSAGTNRQQVRLQVIIPLTTGGISGVGTSVRFFLDYVALAVTYCEEKRIAYGAQQFGYSYGMNQVTMRDLSQAANPAVAAGIYVPTLSFVSMGQVGFGYGVGGSFPKLNAIRELYQIPSHPGVQVNVPFPLEDRIGDVFTSETTHVLPELSLHTSAGTMTEPHVYGRQVAAQVYGVNTATQDIYDDISSAAASYPQVRYYARRYGDTTIPLTLTGISPTGLALPGIVGSTATTPDAAALDIVGDLDIRADLATPDWLTPTFATVVSKWNQNGTNQRSYLLQIAATGGALQLAWSADGINALTALSTVAVPVTSGRLAVRATIDVDNGAAGRTITFYTAPTSAGPYVQLGAPVVQAGVTSIFNSTALGEIGGHSNSAVGTATIPMTVYSAQILNGIAGVAAANPDFTAQAPGTTNFADAAGRTWTINGTAAIVGGNTGSTASVTVAEFDALQEILDGWKEVTLRFGTAASMGAGPSVYPAWTWSAAAETAGNRWEILGASAPAISGVPGSFYTLVPSPNQLSSATYQPPGGTTAELTWMPQGVGTPFVTGASLDVTSDAVLIFSQDPPMVSGVGLTALTQAVTGIGLDCGSLPCCIPSGISYQRVTWGAAANVVTGMVLPGVAGSYASTPDAASLDIVGDVDLRADVTLNNWSSGAYQILVGKWNDPANASYRLAISDTGFIQMAWSSTGANIFVATSNVVAPGTAGRLAVRAFLDVDNGAAGNTVTFYTAQTMAGPWMVLGTPVTAGGITSVFSGNAVLEVGTFNTGTGAPAAGVMHSVEVRNSASVVVANPNFDNQAAGTTSFADTATPAKTWTLSGTAAIRAVSPPWFGAYELQRFDAYDLTGDFQTIMLCTSPTVTGFNDFEARVGITSVYRIRSLNALNFAGLWSTYVSGSPPTPGVTGGCANATGALIFTSNADQSGLSNAAYTMQWEGTPTEDFGLPEGDSVAYQPMYGRDGSVAFHGTERELETFSRTVLLNAAAISPIRLADAKTLRDLAWADLPYVCVRDDIGDRWFASVRVPGINVRANRTKYMARVEIVETTQTPAPVDP